jgi:hypothetical protein
VLSKMVQLQQIGLKQYQFLSSILSLRWLNFWEIPMRNLALLFALVGGVGLVVVSIKAGTYTAERKVATDILNISEMQMRANTNLPVTAIKDHM